MDFKDDICRCGHLKSAHAGYAEGCWAAACPCKKFSHGELEKDHPEPGRALQEAERLQMEDWGSVDDPSLLLAEVKAHRDFLFKLEKRAASGRMQNSSAHTSFVWQVSDAISRHLQEWKERSWKAERNS